MPLPLEQNAQRLQHIVLVVRDQDPAHQLIDEPRFTRAVNQPAWRCSEKARHFALLASIMKPASRSLA
jgi:hypothetical protein